MLRLVGALCILGCATAGETPPQVDDDTGGPFPDAGSGIIYQPSPDAPRPPWDAVAQPDASPPCVGGQASSLDPVTGSCYLFFNTQMIWPNAKGACETMTPRGHLATIADAEEAQLVATLANGAETWIGLTDLVTEGNFRWVTAETFLFTDWASGEPNDTGDCARLQNGRWADLGCTNNRPYICEWP